MIRSWANSRSRRFYEQGKTSKFGGMDTEAAEDLLAILDAAESLKDISPLKSVGFAQIVRGQGGTMGDDDKRAMACLFPL